MFRVPQRWCVHAYYSLCPYAPDGSGRILIAGADLEQNVAEVIVLSAQGEQLQRIGAVPIQPSFWHTGLWQSWSPDSKMIYFQSGSLEAPRTTRYHLETGESIEVDGDIEGIPPCGEPAISCDHGMLYAAGYGGHSYNPELCRVPFQARTKHGISKIDFQAQQTELILSTQAILEQHPLRDQILQAEQAIQARLGPDEGLTLMTYCVRWNRSGTRCLFFFGNHCVDRSRQEPKITSIFTADRDLKNIHMAIDLSFDRRGVHWAWQADDEHLIGYGPDPVDSSKICLAEIRYDGTGYRKICAHASGGHPSTSPANHDLIVTDEGSASGGNVVFISKQSGQTIHSVALPKFVGASEASGRNPLRVCHHPVFNHTGDRVLCNSLPDDLATLVELQAPSIES